MQERRQTAGGADAETGLSTGLCAKLGVLGEGALVTETGLAEMLGKHPVSVKRAVERGELPPPTRLMGKPVWTVGAIRRHIEARLESETEKRQRLEEKMAAMSP